MADYSLVIEGFKKWIGTKKPSWFEGDLVDGIANTPKLSQEIDPLGGIAQISPVTFDLVDSEYDFARTIRFDNDNSLQITGPSPLLYSDTDLTLNTVSHPTAQAITNAATGMDTYDNPDLYLWEDFTFFMRYKPTSFATTPNIFSHYTDANNNTLPYISATGTVKWQRSYVGSSQILESTETLNLNEYNTVAIRINGTALTSHITVNGVTVNGALSTTWPIPTWVTSQLYAYSSGTSFLPGAIADTKIYKRSVTAAEVANLEAGIAIDDTSLVFDGNYDQVVGKTLQDKSGRGNHLTLNTAQAWADRDLIQGDILYLPRDAVRVQSISGTVATVERQVYSCLEDGYYAYYHQPNDLEYVCLAHTDNPHPFEGRLVAYYKGDDLEYLGYVNTIAQRGKSWKLSTKSILEPLSTGLKNYGYSMPLKHSDGTKWYMGLIWLDPGDTSWATDILSNEVNEGIPESEMYYNLSHQTSGAAWQPGWWFKEWGFRFKRSTNALISERPYSEGLIDTMFDTSDGTLYAGVDEDYVYSHPSSPIKNYGVVLSTGCKVKTEANNPESFVGQYLKVKDGAMMLVESYDSGTEYFTLKGTYNDNLVLNSDVSCGYSSDSPITLTIEPWVKSNNLLELVYSIMTSTGAGTNGSYDLFSGLYGLGLPSTIVSSLLCTCDNMDNVVVNLSEGKLKDDLQAMGIGLVFANGKFKLNPMNIPIISLATDTVTTAMVQAGERTNLNFGYYHPLKSISYKGYSYNTASEAKDPYEIKISVQNSNIFFGSIGRDKTWTSQIKNLATGDAFRIRILKLLKWFNNFAPVVDLVIPDYDIEICDVVNLEVDDMAGQGGYGVENLPALVVGKGDDFKIKAILNTSVSTQQAPWVPSWEIESYTGGTLTLRKAEGLSLADVVDLPASMQILRADGTAIGNYTANSVTDEDTIVLSAAPTYNQSIYRGILTLKDYTDTSNSARTGKYVWCSNTAGIMSDSDPGKDFS